MATLTIIFLLILAWLLAIFKYKKTSVILFVISIISFLGVALGLFPALLLPYLENSYASLEQPQWGQSNAIIILGVGLSKSFTNDYQPYVIAYSRLYEGLRLYQDCKKTKNQCTVFVSGGDTRNIGTTEAAIYKNALLALGASDADVRLESQSLDTFENAKYMSQALKAEKFDQIFLVTSGVHLKRAMQDFAYFGLKPIPVPSDYLASQYSYYPLAQNFLVTNAALHEYAGISKSFLRTHACSGCKK